MTHIITFLAFFSILDINLKRSRYSCLSRWSVFFFFLAAAWTADLIFFTVESGPWYVLVLNYLQAVISSALLNRVSTNPSRSWPSFLLWNMTFWHQENPSSAVSFSCSLWFCFIRFFIIGLAFAYSSSNLEILVPDSLMLLPKLLIVSIRDSTQFWQDSHVLFRCWLTQPPRSH